MLNENEIKEIKEALNSAERPFFIFHDDPDGLASFLLFYRKIEKGKGMPLKAFPRVTEDYADKVKAYGADKVFVLDIALVDQEFIDSAGVPVYWIDHHEVQCLKRVKYYNPRKTTGENIPTPVLCYQVVERDLWIATVGAIGDWHIPFFIENFKEKYPELYGSGGKSPEDFLYGTKAGELALIFSFNLKGPIKEVMNSIKILTRIESPFEILEGETSSGKFLLKKYNRVRKNYDELLNKARENASEDKFLVYTYDSDILSLTKDAANELLNIYPDKVIILGRHKSGEFRCSLRSGPKINLRNALETALQSVRGKGGGHEQACGAGIHEDDFQEFLKILRVEVERQS